MKIYDNKVKPDFEKLDLDLDKYSGNIDPDGQMQKQDEFDYEMGVKNANLLKTFFLSKKDKNRIKIFISIIIALIIMYFPVKDLFNEVKIKEITNIEEKESIPTIKDIAKVNSFSNENGEVYAIAESKKDIYRIPLDKDMQKKINVGDTLYLNIKETLIPTINIEKVVKE
ncbi:hypothetical protein [Peptoniphilus rhinitidis]|uniref:hypothetical protein n=1 Tax=Peptoniphilus rhinitidis TaxID=1175452 RepID=UPI000289324D|nr:hypothetical protein [Peptoniphilus rhinitidis]